MSHEKVRDNDFKHHEHILIGASHEIGGKRNVRRYKTSQKTKRRLEQEID